MMGDYAEVEKHLWDGGDELRANSKLNSSESFVSLLGLSFLQYTGKGGGSIGKIHGQRPDPAAVLRLIYL